MIGGGAANVVPKTPPPESSIPWIGPFAVFILWLALDRFIPLEYPVKELVRDCLLAAAILGFSWRVVLRRLSRVKHWTASIALGLAVCAIWIAPDTLLPGWRDHVWFQNVVVGRIGTSIPPDELSPLMLVLRTLRAVVLVPVIEEIFWRGWLPRWLQNSRFDRVLLGNYTPFAFWATALLFAAEHGPFWEVGLICGVAYNWWMRRTRSLADLVLVHGTTNLALSIYVIFTQRWMFWM